MDGSLIYWGDAHGDELGNNKWGAKPADYREAQRGPWVLTTFLTGPRLAHAGPISLRINVKHDPHDHGQLLSVLEVEILASGCMHVPWHNADTPERPYKWSMRSRDPSAKVGRSRCGDVDLSIFQQTRASSFLQPTPCKMGPTSLPKGSRKKLKLKRGSKISAASSKVAAPRERLAANSLKWKTVKNTASFAGIDEGGGMMMLEELDDVGVEWQEESGAKIARFVAVEPKKSKGKAKEQEPEAEEVDDDAASVTSSADISFEEVDDDAASVTSSADISFEEVDVEDDNAVSEEDGLDSEDEEVVADMEDEIEEEESEAELEVEESFNGESSSSLLIICRSYTDALLPEWKGIDIHTSLKRALLGMGFVKPTEIQARAVAPGSSGRDIVGVAETVSPS